MASLIVISKEQFLEAGQGCPIGYDWAQCWEERGEDHPPSCKDCGYYEGITDEGITY